MLAVATRHGRFASLARRKLWCGTALALCVSIAGPALAQTVPVVSNAGGAIVTPTPTSLSVDINGASRVVTYSSFVLGSPSSSSETLTFLNGGAAGSFSVLNRVTGGSGSQIYGSISAPSDITVWIVDPMGVTFGPTGSFSGGGLIVSTALLTGADETSFLAGTLNALNGASTAPIRFLSGSGAIDAAGSIVAVGQQIVADKTITSSAGTVALVAGTDVSFTNINSPLSFTVSRGTTLATGVTVGNNGVVSGQSVRIAGGVDGVVTAALLQVDQNAQITASAANGSILLSTGNGNGVTIANGGLTPGINTLGTLQAAGANADITIVGAGAVSIGGALIAGQDVTLSSLDAAAGTVTAAGNVTAGRNYSVAARDVVLGTNATTTTQQAGGALAVTAGGGNIVGLGNLALRSNTDGIGAEALSLDAAAGLVNLAGTTSLTGGTAANRSDVTLRASGITAGNVTARALLRIGNATDLTATGNITLGDVTVDSALRITSGGAIQGGALVSNNGAIRLDAHAAGSVTAQSLNAANAIDVLSNTSIRLASALSTTGSINLASLNGDVTGLTLGVPASDGRPFLNFGRTDLSASAAGQTITVTASNGTAQLGTLVAGTGASALGANQIAISARAIDLTGATAVNGHVDLEASNGAIRARTLSAGSASALGDVIVNGPLGAVTIDGAVSASRDYRVTGSSVTLGATGATVTQAANGAVTIRANTGNINGLGTLTVQANQDGAGAETLYLNGAGVASAVNFSAASTLLGGLPGGTAAQRSDVLITSAAPLILGNVTANSLRTSGNATDLVGTGAITTGNVTVDQSLRIASSAGSITTGNIESKAGSIRLDAQTAGAVTAGTVKAANAINLLASTNIRLTSAEAIAGSIQLAATSGGISNQALGKANLTANGANQTIQVTAGGAVLLGTVSAGSGAGQLGTDQISVTAGSLDVNSATAVNGNVHLVTNAGTLLAGALSAGTPTILADVIVNASGAATVSGAVSASRDYSVTGSSVTLGNLSSPITQSAGRTITITATGGNILGLPDLTLQSTLDIILGATAGTVTIGGDVSAQRDYSVTGTSVTLGDVSGPATQSAGGQLSVTATNGDITGLANLTLQSTLNATFGATGAVTLRGGVAALGNYSVTGASATLGNGANAVTQSAGGLISLTTTSGGITGDAGLLLQSGGNTTVNAAGAANLQGNVTAGGDYSVTGASVALGGTSGAVTQSAGGLISVTATGGDLTGLANLTLQSTGNATFSATGAASLQGNVTAGTDYNVTGASVSLGGTSGAVTQSAGGLISVTATGGDLTGLANLTLQSTGNATFSATGAASLQGNVTAGTDYNVTGASVALGGTSGAVTQSAGGLISVTATGGDLTGLANLTLQSTGNATFSATGTASLQGNVTTGADYSVTGASVSLGGTGAAVTQSAGGLISVTATGGDLTGLANLTLQSTGNATFSATGAASLQGNIAAGNHYSVTGASVSLGGTGAAVTQSAGGSISVTANTGDLTAFANLLLQSTSSATFNAAGTASLQGNVTSGTDYSVTGTSVSLGGTGTAVTQSAGGLISVTATGGNLTGLANLTLQSTGNATFSATGAASLQGNVAAGNNYSVTGASVSLGGTGAAVTQSAAGLISVTANTGDLTGLANLTLQSGGDTTLSAAGAASLQGNVAATGNYSVTGASVTLGNTGTPVTQSAGGSLSVTATGGDILGLADLSLQSTLDSTFTATGAVALRGTVTAQRDYSVNGSSVTLGNAGVAITQSAGRTLTVNSTGDVTGLAGLTLHSDGDAIFSAAGAAVLPGDVSAIGNYSVTGASVTLGTAGSAITQSAGGLVTITATGTDITGLGQLLLQSNTDGAGAEALTLDAAGSVNFASTSTILGGVASGPVGGRSDILIRSLPSLALGKVTGRSLRSIGNATELVVTGAMLTGDITVDQALAVRTASGSIATGVVTVQGAGESLRLSAGGTTSDLTTGILQTNGGDILLTAGRDVAIGAVATAPSGTPATGTIAILAGRDILASTLAAGEDIALSGGNLTFTTANAGDDIDIATTGTVSLISAISSGAGLDTRAVQFDRSVAGQPAAVALAGAAGQTGHNLSIRAAVLTSPVALTGDTDAGLVVRNLTSGAQTITADRGDIRAGTLTANGDIDITAGQGSVSGLRNGWTATTGGATLQAPGAIVLDGVGAANFAIGSVTAASVSTGAGAPDTLRLGSVTAGSLNLTAGSNLQIDNAQISGTAQLRTTGGTAAAFNLTDPSLVAGYGRATLASGNDIGVSASGAAQLGPVNAARDIDVTAAATDIDTATALNGALLLRTTSGRLTLGTGIAGTTASLIKEDAEIGLPKTATDNLLTAGSVTAGGAASFRSATSATIGTASAASGDLSVNARNDATIGTGTAAGGAIQVLAGRNASATTLTAEDIAVRAGGDATLGTLAAGDNIALDAGGALAITSATSSGAGADNRNFTLDTALAGQAGAITVGAAPAADGDIRATGGTSVSLGQLNTALGNVAVTATTGNVTGLPGGGSITARAAGKAISVTATGGNVQLATLTAGQGNSTIPDTQIGVTAKAIDLQTATAANGALVLTATDAGLTLGNGTAGTNATLISRGGTGELTVSGTLTAAKDIAVQSQTSARLGSLVSSAGSIGVLAQSEVTGIAGGAVNLTAFEDAAISAGGAVRIGAIKAGDDINIDTAGSVDLVSAITDGGAHSDARTIVFDRTQIGQAAGVAFRQTATLTPQPAAGSNITIRAASLGGPALTGDTDTGLVIGSLTGGSLALTAAQGDIRADSLTATSGDVAATAKGSVTGRRSGFQSASGGSTISANGQVTFDVSGSVSAGAVTAGTAVTNAGGATSASIRLRSVNAGSLTLNASTGVQVDGGTVTGAVTLGTTGGTVGGASGYGSAAMTAQAAGKAITIDAGGTAQLGAIEAGQAGSSAAGNQITIRAAGARIGSARARNGDILIEAKGGLALLGAIETGDAARTVLIRNTGTGSTIVGGTTADNATDIALDDSEMDLISSGNVVVDSKAQALTIQKLTIAAATGKTSLRLLSTGNIDLNDTISGDGTGVLQIGGSSIADPDGLVDETKLAAQIKADIGDSGTKAAILLPNGTVDLRARKIVFARPRLIDKYLPSSGTGPTNASVAFDVANAASELYTSDGTGRVFLTAKTLKVSYSNYALFQNTAAASGGGVSLNEVSPPSITALALQLFSTGDRADNSFALFGHINGFFGRAAGILPNESIQFSSVGGNPRVTRIAQGNSRVNGCVIGSPDKGCLVTDPPRPNFSIYDQRQTQLFGMADDPLLFFNPLVGRGNEGLIVDIADAPVGIDTIECDPAKGPCPTTGAPK